jgi:hypothetical protein
MTELSLLRSIFIRDGESRFMITLAKLLSFTKETTDFSRVESQFPPNHPQPRIERETTGFRRVEFRFPPNRRNAP